MTKTEQCFVCSGDSPALFRLKLIQSSGWLGPGKATGFVPAGIFSINVAVEQSILNLPACNSERLVLLPLGFHGSVKPSVILRIASV